MGEDKTITTLKACPFCGGEGRLGGAQTVSGDIESWVECRNGCGANVRAFEIIDRGANTPAEMLQHHTDQANKVMGAWNARI